MKLRLTESEKPQVFSEIEDFIRSSGLQVTSRDVSRPWGGFFVIDESQAKEFAALFFPGVDVSSLRISGKLSPKILVVAAGQRLSWQYHHRRAEIWRVIHGEVGVMTSPTDTEGELKKLYDGESIRLGKGTRHRLVGLDNWGVLAEIWQHTDPDHPSDETDIVRVQDDFGR